MLQFISDRAALPLGEGPCRGHSSSFKAITTPLSLSVCPLTDHRAAPRPVSDLPTKSHCTHKRRGPVQDLPYLI